MDRQEINHMYNGHLTQLRKIVSTWDLMTGVPSYEFDTLCNTVLSHLYQQADLQKIERVIESELIVRYGFFQNEIAPEAMAHDVMNWWEANQ